IKAKPKSLFGPVSRIFAPTTMSPKLDSPYRRLMNGASGRYDGAIVNVVGTVIGRVRAVAGRVVVASTMPGRMLPTGEPMPGKFDALPKLPLPPNGVPMRLVYGGAVMLPLKTKILSVA